MPPASSPIRVLVIDDDQMSRELLALLLDGEGYAVDSAESGEVALSGLSESASTPDLVLTDMQLPGISGADLARRLREACGPSTLLLAISGSRPAQEAASLFDGFLLKPFQMEDVAKALRARDLRRRAAKLADSPSSRKSGRYRRTSAVTSMDTVARTISPPAASNQDMNAALQVEGGGRGSVAGSGTIPVLNETIFQQLARTMLGSQLREMYKLCLDDARRRIADMRKLAAEHDVAQFVREAHAIKGGTGMLGATELHRKAAELESQGLAGTQGVNSLDELSAACDRLERMLGARL